MDDLKTQRGACIVNRHHDCSGVDCTCRCHKIDDGQVIYAMLYWGGGFVTALAKLYQLADERNRARLKATFSDYWEQYAKMGMPGER